MVEVAASIAQAASTALPPFPNVIAPAVAASGFPVIATQCRPCSTGLAVAASARSPTASATSRTPGRRQATLRITCLRVAAGMLHHPFLPGPATEGQDAHDRHHRLRDGDGEEHAERPEAEPAREA